MKIWNVIILPKAEKRLERMPRQERKRILKVLTHSEMTLSGTISSRYRISRFGDFV